MLIPCALKSGKTNPPATNAATRDRLGLFTFAFTASFIRGLPLRPCLQLPSPFEEGFVRDFLLVLFLELSLPFRFGRLDDDDDDCVVWTVYSGVGFCDISEGKLDTWTM